MRPSQIAAEDDRRRVESGFFFGRIAFENEVIAIDIRKPRVRAFVTTPSRAVLRSGSTARCADGA